MSSAQPPHDSNPFHDLSGISTTAFKNPYDTLIRACDDDAAAVQEKYTVHRTTRNAQQKAKMLAADFPGVTIDPILARLTDQTIEPGYVDPRHCLVFWGRPTKSVKALIKKVQDQLLTVAPNLWLMPQECLHITALELTHSKTAPEIQHLINCMSTAIPNIVSHTQDHRARLIKPLISYDASAIALSFVPGAGESLPKGRTVKDDDYTYHHLRRDLHHLCTQTGVQVDSRYVVPSSHLTIGRFIVSKDLETAGKPDPKKMERLIKKIEQINALLERDYWPRGIGEANEDVDEDDDDEEEEEDEIEEGGEWLVGKETGLTCRFGTLWYGGGEAIASGKGF
ncbi:hypothetical protein K504DRAFT_428547 [Pleomassaria siparia CBS 279.74]|uniref:RNA ligase/cyclic nucleotide phosphodiesterase n=1 Tax=Pleomassaria siparia CBS 279.74 TaxID=1314801 RepID=A0A6G1KGL8_9PLEO|nr:hypothetical protein K504DRAFT_428547 [Pleomassaria siparia CBS 279.74]